MLFVTSKRRSLISARALMPDTDQPAGGVEYAVFPLLSAVTRSRTCYCRTHFLVSYRGAGLPAGATWRHWQWARSERWATRTTCQRRTPPVKQTQPRIQQCCRTGAPYRGLRPIRAELWHILGISVRPKTVSIWFWFVPVICASILLALYAVA